MKLHYSFAKSQSRKVLVKGALIVAAGILCAAQSQAQPYPNYGFPPTNTAYPAVSGFEGFQLQAPYTTENPFGEDDLEAISSGFGLFTTETFGGNGRTCKSCHLPDKNYNIALKDFESLPPTDQALVLGGDNANLENEEAVTKAMLFNIHQGAGAGTQGNIVTPLGPFRASMTIGGVGFTVLNDHVCKAGATTPALPGAPATACRGPGNPANVAGAPNNAIDDGMRDLMLGWSGEGPLEEMFPFVEPDPSATAAADCEAIIEEFGDSASSLRDLDLALSTFTLAAVKTHFPRTQNRQPGVDFRCPTRDELLEMAEFQKMAGASFRAGYYATHFHRGAGPAWAQPVQHPRCDLCGLSCQCQRQR